MKKIHLQNGRHPIVNIFIPWIKELELIIKTYDIQSRIIPNKFDRVRSQKISIEMCLNEKNLNQIYLRMFKARWVQNITIDCSSSNKCLEIYKFLLHSGKKILQNKEKNVKNTGEIVI